MPRTCYGPGFPFQAEGYALRVVRLRSKPTHGVHPAQAGGFPLQSLPRELQVIAHDKIETLGGEESKRGQKEKYFTFFRTIYSNLLCKVIFLGEPFLGFTPLTITNETRTL
jgi:hypothetical protein